MYMPDIEDGKPRDRLREKIFEFIKIWIKQGKLSPDTNIYEYYFQNADLLEFYIYHRDPFDHFREDRVRMNKGLAEMFTVKQDINENKDENNCRKNKLEFARENDEAEKPIIADIIRCSEVEDECNTDSEVEDVDEEENFPSMNYRNKNDEEEYDLQYRYDNYDNDSNEGEYYDFRDKYDEYDNDSEKNEYLSFRDRYSNDIDQYNENSEGERFRMRFYDNNVEDIRNDDYRKYRYCVNYEK